MVKIVYVKRDEQEIIQVHYKHIITPTHPSNWSALKRIRIHNEHPMGD